MIQTNEMSPILSSPSLPKKSLQLFFFYQTIMLCPSPTGATLLDHAINLYILASI